MLKIRDKIGGADFSGKFVTLISRWHWTVLATLGLGIGLVSRSTATCYGTRIIPFAF